MSRSASGSRSKQGVSAGKTGKRGKGVKNEPEEDDGPIEIGEPQLEWKILSEQVTKELADLEVEDVAKKMAEALSLSSHEKDLREAALLDYYVSGYWFAAREENFTESQISAFITILHNILDNLKTKQLSLRDNVQTFKELVAGVGKPPSPELPNPLKCFTLNEGLVTLRYLKSSLFQHYSLFQYLFTEEQEEEIVTQKLLVDVPPDPQTLCPPPLEEAVTLDLYERFISPPTPPQEEQEEGIEEDFQKTGECVDVNEELKLVDELKCMKVSADELRTVMEDVAKMKLTSYKEEVVERLKRKEEAMLTRLSKLEKSLT